MGCCDDDCKMGEMMKECIGTCRCCGFMCLGAGIISFLLGYFLSPETVRILWLFLSGISVLMGLLCCIQMGANSKK